MKLLIVEDEPVAAKRLTDMLQTIDRSMEVKAVTESIASTMDFLRSGDSVDLIFMDVELGDGQSLQIFEKGKVNAPVIFLTAYKQFAFDAYQQNVLDYLLKPLRLPDLEKALAKYYKLLPDPVARDSVSMTSGDTSGFQRQRFLARVGARLLPITIDKVAYFYARGRLLYIKTTDGRDYAFNKTLDQLEAELDPATFFRVNRQFLIRYESIEKAESWFSGKLRLQVNPNPFEEIIISRLKATEFKRWLGE